MGQFKSAIPMRNITRPYSYSEACDQSVWISPAPYVLGAAGAIIVLIIATFFIVVLCHGKKRSASRSEESNREASDPIIEYHGEKDMVTTMSNYSDETERKIINVIMAGDEKPTFIAKPTLSQGPTT